MLFANLNEDKHVQDDSLKLSFVVKCLECMEESVYKPSDLRKWPLTLPEGWEPHLFFRKP